MSKSGSAADRSQSRGRQSTRHDAPRKPRHSRTARLRLRLMRPRSLLRISVSTKQSLRFDGHGSVHGSVKADNLGRNATGARCAAAGKNPVPRGVDRNERVRTRGEPSRIHGLTAGRGRWKEGIFGTTPSPRTPRCLARVAARGKPPLHGCPARGTERLRPRGFEGQFERRAPSGHGPLCSWSCLRRDAERRGPAPAPGSAGPGPGRRPARPERGEGS